MAADLHEVAHSDVFALAPLTSTFHDPTPVD
jgi:hypothetical protein